MIFSTARCCWMGWYRIVRSDWEKALWFQKSISTTILQSVEIRCNDPCVYSLWCNRLSMQQVVWTTLLKSWESWRNKLLRKRRWWRFRRHHLGVQGRMESSFPQHFLEANRWTIKHNSLLDGELFPWLTQDSLRAKTEVGYFGGLHLSSLVLLQPFWSWSWKELERQRIENEASVGCCLGCTMTVLNTLGVVGAYPRDSWMLLKWKQSVQYVILPYEYLTQSVAIAGPSGSIGVTCSLDLIAGHNWTNLKKKEESWLQSRNWKSDWLHGNTN